MYCENGSCQNLFQNGIYKNADTASAASIPFIKCYRERREGNPKEGSSSNGNVDGNYNSNGGNKERSDGKDGTNGKDGYNDKDGTNDKDGYNGKDGTNVKDETNNNDGYNDNNEYNDKDGNNDKEGSNENNESNYYFIFQCVAVSSPDENATTCNNPGDLITITNKNQEKEVQVCLFGNKSTKTVAFPSENASPLFIMSAPDIFGRWGYEFQVDKIVLKMDSSSIYIGKYLKKFNFFFFYIGI